MLDHTDTTESLPPPIILSPADSHREYSPSLLLEHSELNQLLVCNESFYEWCGDGFTGFFECMYESDGSGLRFVFHLRTLSLTDVTDEIFLDFCSRLARSQSLSLVANSAGFYLGWLSALALSQPDLASTGMTILTSLVGQILKSNAVRESQRRSLS